MACLKDRLPNLLPRMEVEDIKGMHHHQVPSHQAMALLPHQWAMAMVHLQHPQDQDSTISHLQTPSAPSPTAASNSLPNTYLNNNINNNLHHHNSLDSHHNNISNNSSKHTLNKPHSQPHLQVSPQDLRLQVRDMVDP